MEGVHRLRDSTGLSLVSMRAGVIVTGGLTCMCAQLTSAMAIAICCYPSFSLAYAHSPESCSMLAASCSVNTQDFYLCLLSVLTTFLVMSVCLLHRATGTRLGCYMSGSLTAQSTSRCGSAMLALRRSHYHSRMRRKMRNSE